MMIELRSDIQKWIRIAFINLLIVALLGTIMRYKIAYYFPLIEQKNFLHAHSHFAFAGWVTQVLITMLVAYLSMKTHKNFLKKYKWLLTANLVTAYGMLLSFPWEGYGIVSITFSTLSIFVSYAFAFFFWKDLNRLPAKSVSHLWFKAALIFNIISSIGAFALAYMLANKMQHPSWYLATIYYFLHFQYNGWFFFTCMGLLCSKLVTAGVKQLFLKRIFLMFVLACVPTYFLSALWLPIPFIVYLLVVLAAALQLIGWIFLLIKIIKFRAAIFATVLKDAKIILILSGIALSIKLLLQAGSTIPYLSKIAFGFRPVVIGYLHLVLLGVITLFIIGYSKMNNFIFTNRIGNSGIIIFISGIILNEIFLMIQGVSYMSYINVPWINELLLGAAICMLCGVSLLNLGLIKRNYTYG